jgi:hypothetical protein
MDNQIQWAEMASVTAHQEELDMLRELVRHLWAHQAYHDLGYAQLSQDRQQLFDQIVGRKQESQTVAHR